MMSGTKWDKQERWQSCSILRIDILEEIEFQDKIKGSYESEG